MKRLKITVDGTPYDVTVEEISDTPAPLNVPTPSVATTVQTPSSSPAPSAPTSPQASGLPGELTSPLAGTVLKVDVKVGQAVQAGEPVARLEAMKMESVLNAPISGTVKAVHVNDGDTVQEGTPLLTIG